MFNSLRPYGLFRSCNSPGQNSRVGSPSLLEGIFPTQEWKPGLLHCRGILYQLSHNNFSLFLENQIYHDHSKDIKGKN